MRAARRSSAPARIQTAQCPRARRKLIVGAVQHSGSAVLSAVQSASAEQCSTAQSASAEQYSTVQCRASAVQWRAAQCGALQLSAAQCHTKFSTEQGRANHSAMLQCSAMMQCKPPCRVQCAAVRIGNKLPFNHMITICQTGKGYSQSVSQPASQSQSVSQTISQPASQPVSHSQ